MKKLCIIAALALLMAVPAHAQLGSATEAAKIGINIYAGGGLSFPMGDLGDGWKTGYHGMGAISMRFFPAVETTARYAYHSFPIDVDDGDADFTVAEYGLDLRVNLSPPGLNFSPYALVGIGAAKFDFKINTGDPALDDFVNAAFDQLEPETKFFYCFGGGIKVKALPRLNFFLEGRYSKIAISESDISYLPFTIGLNLSL